MGSIDDEGVDLLVASGPDDVGEAELGGRLGAGFTEEDLERGERGLGILAIESAAEGKCGWDLGKGSEVGGVIEWGVSFASDRGNFFAHAWFVCAEDDGDVGFDDAGFFGGDLFKCVAEPIAMVESDASDDGEGGLADVGGVEATAEARFEDGPVGAGRVIDEEGDGGECFEEGEVLEGGGCGFERGEALGGAVECGVVKGLAVEEEAFVDVDEVGRGVACGCEVCGAEASVEDGAGGAFAVGAGDVEGGEVVFGVAERGRNCADGVEAWFDAEALACGESRKKVHFLEGDGDDSDGGGRVAKEDEPEDFIGEEDFFWAASVGLGPGEEGVAEDAGEDEEGGQPEEREARAHFGGEGVGEVFETGGEAGRGDEGVEDEGVVMAEDGARLRGSFEFMFALAEGEEHGEGKGADEEPGGDVGVDDGGARDGAEDEAEGEGDDVDVRDALEVARVEALHDGVGEDGAEGEGARGENHDDGGWIGKARGKKDEGDADGGDA